MAGTPSPEASTGRKLRVQRRKPRWRAPVGPSPATGCHPKPWRQPYRGDGNRPGPPPVAGMLGGVASAGSVLAVGAVGVIGSLLELLLGLAKRPGQLGELGAAEQQQDDGQNDE